MKNVSLSCELTENQRAGPGIQKILRACVFTWIDFKYFTVHSLMNMEVVKKKKTQMVKNACKTMQIQTSF